MHPSTHVVIYVHFILQLLDTQVEETKNDLNRDNINIGWKNNNSDSLCSAIMP